MMRTKDINAHIPQRALREIYMPYPNPLFLCSASKLPSKNTLRYRTAHNFYRLLNNL